MSEEINLPESLGRLEINPERGEPTIKAEKAPPLATPPIIVAAALNKDDPESSLEALSLNAECPKGTCHCNKKREKEKGVKRLATKRPILRKSKLNILKALQPPQSSLLAEPSNSMALTVEGPRVVGGSFQTTIHSNKHHRLPSPSGPIRPPRLVLNVQAVEASSSSFPSTLPSLLSTTTQRQQTQLHCCAVQARLEHTPSDDTNIDELASYFDLFVHIPKKMSRMAEMMYI